MQSRVGVGAAGDVVPAAGVAPPRRAPPALLVVATVLAAIALRVWILASPIGRADGDEAVVGLMARAFLRGDFSVFFWGQAYGGAVEPGLVALAFGAGGTSTVALKLVPVTLAGIASWLIWRVGRRTVGEPAAATAGLLFLVFPPAFLWWSTKERGFYWAALVLGLGVLLAALRIGDSAPDPRRRDLAALGLLAGLAWWVTPQSMYLVAPVLCWLSVRHARLWKRAWPAVPAAMAGAVPWIAWNLLHGLSSFDEPNPWVTSTYLERLGRFFTTLLPTLLGARHAFTGNWLLGPVGVVFNCAVVCAFAVFVVRAVRVPERWRRVEPLIVVAVTFPFLFALPKASHYVIEPRYGLMLTPVIALLVAVPVVTRARQIAVALLAVTLGFVTVAALERFGERNPMVVDLTPPRLGGLVAALDAAGVDRVYADYWIAYPLTFETRERIVGTPVDAVRSARLDRMVEEADKSTYVVFLDSPRDAAMKTDLRDRGIAFDRAEVEVFAVYFLERAVAPDELSEVFGR